MSSAVPRTSAGSSSTVSAKLVPSTCARACAAFHWTDSAAECIVIVSWRVLGLDGSIPAFISCRRISGFGASAAAARVTVNDARTEMNRITRCMAPA